MSERWGDSQRDRDALDRWITQDPRDLEDDDGHYWEEVVPTCLICNQELVEGKAHDHTMSEVVLAHEQRTIPKAGQTVTVKIHHSGNGLWSGLSMDQTDTLPVDTTAKEAKNGER